MSSRYQILYFYTLANLQKRQKQAPFAMVAVWADTHVEQAVLAPIPLFNFTVTIHEAGYYSTLKVHRQSEVPLAEVSSAKLVQKVRPCCSHSWFGFLLVRCLQNNLLLLLITRKKKISTGFQPHTPMFVCSGCWEYILPMGSYGTGLGLLLLTLAFMPLHCSTTIFFFLIKKISIPQPAID